MEFSCDRIGETRNGTYVYTYKYFELTVEFESRAYSWIALTKSQLIPDLSFASIHHETLTIHGSANRLHI